jgi:predicted translin family RNA/ssDNA-binding protein
LITQEEVVRSLPDGILVTNTDYLLGLFDFTGEIMKFAVTSMTAKSLPASQGDEETDGQPESGTKTAGEVRATLGQGHDVVTDLRDLRAMFERLNVPRNQGISKDFQSKMDVMQASVEKVERAAYGLLVRGKERPTGWVPDMSAAAPVETF